MKLITTPNSPYGRKVRIVLAEKRIDYELLLTDLSQPDHLAVAHNPLGKVPVLLLDDGKPVYDSSVIVDYLDHISPVSRLLPDSPRQAVSVKRREALADGIVDAIVAIALERRRPEAQQSADWISKQRNKIDRGIIALAEDLGDKKYLINDNYGLADIASGVMLAYLRFRLPEIVWQDEHPALDHYLQRLEERASFQETRPA
ncbi:glutathione S-transferase N-terminal domain-containing protein [Chitinilyticum piscinae]|uniref:Glutathione S-transferase N-terminal domain-containing protein n=1 Tax=Chitinilyticum piscinae TaxID=2866724 RepID=A0A8J7FMP2_9NEIS|nr:glutathione S-transferase N-terminal domain-containing protein [Chitinilyticum piscinae]MBE9610365.1 glutathione S-transferase N-terminal domain-containing protein [Chitinilyticum piscinae]